MNPLLTWTAVIVSCVFIGLSAFLLTTETADKVVVDTKPSRPVRPERPVEKKWEPPAGSLVTGPSDSKEKRKPGKIADDAQQEFTTTDLGLKYRILRLSDGQKPNALSKVTVDYKGWLDNGDIFDSSYRNEAPVTFTLNELIRGWQLGMKKIGVGGMVELEVPPDLGYGAGGQGIPPNATLHFIVELIEVN